MTLETWTAFFGWMTVLNFVFLLAATLALTLFRPGVLSLHSKVSKLSEDDLNRAYFSYLANYKVMVIVTSLVPYLALKLM